MNLSVHLKKAVEANKNESASIAPISESDANIIDSLIKIFNKIYYDDLSSILKQWKVRPDEELLHILNYWLENGPNATKIFIKLGDVEINVHFLQSITLIDSYDYNQQCPIYKIIINKDETEKLLFCNVEAVFYSDEKREEELNKFKEKTKFLKIKYV